MSKIRLSLILGMLAVHVMAGWLFPPVAAGSLYIPAMVAHRIGIPVLAPNSGGWPSPTILGWCVVAGAWLALYLMIAWVVERRLHSREGRHQR